MDRVAYIDFLRTFIVTVPMTAILGLVIVLMPGYSIFEGFLTFFMVLFLLMFLLPVIGIVLTYWGPQRKPIVVRAKQTKKVATGKQAMYQKIRRELDDDYEYVLRFEYYGEYIIPQVVYAFSENYEMTGKELWDSTYPDDEFYLLLDKKNRIISAFHCNNFEYVGQLTKHNVVNGKIVSE